MSNFGFTDGKQFVCQWFDVESPQIALSELNKLERPHLHLIYLVRSALNHGYNEAVDAMFGRTADTQALINENRARRGELAAGE